MSSSSYHNFYTTLTVLAPNFSLSSAQVFDKNLFVCSFSLGLVKLPAKLSPKYILTIWTTDWVDRASFSPPFEWLSQSTTMKINIFEEKRKSCERNFLVVTSTAFDLDFSISTRIKRARAMDAKPQAVMKLCQPYTTKKMKSDFQGSLLLKWIHNFSTHKRRRENSFSNDRKVGCFLLTQDVESMSISFLPLLSLSWEKWERD